MCDTAHVRRLKNALHFTVETLGEVMKQISYGPTGGGRSLSLFKDPSSSDANEFPNRYMFKKLCSKTVTPLSWLLFAGTDLT